MDIQGSARLLSGRDLLVPALICAGISAGLMRIGLFSFFFLIPLGYAAAVYNAAAAWLACIFAVLVNIVFSVVLALYYTGALSGVGLNILYFSVMALGFTWILAGGGMRTVYRFILASVAGALTLLVITRTSMSNSVFTALIKSQAELIASASDSISEADAVKRSVMEYLLSPEKLSELILFISLRGGVLISCFFMFFINRQAALILAMILRRKRPASFQPMIDFHAPSLTIWVLSLSFPVILLSRLVKLEFTEIAAWNILIICAILFLAQGGGIALFTLTRRAMPPLMRLLGNFLIILVIFSPGINALALAALVLLGIAENWLPLRALKTDGPASTPGS